MNTKNGGLSKAVRWKRCVRHHYDIISQTWRRLQRLEDTVLPETNGLHVRDDADEPASVKVSARVRDIITRNLATPDEAWSASEAAEPGIEQLTNENKILQVRLAFLMYFAAETITFLIRAVLCPQNKMTSNDFYYYYPHMPMGKVWMYRLLFVFVYVCLYGYRFLRRG